MNRWDGLRIGVLWLIVLLIFHPLFYTGYLYTDEAVQLWLYKPGTNFQMFITQGRAITELLFQWLFSKAHTGSDVKYIRLFSLAGWTVCIPVWYYVIKRVTLQESLPQVLPFMSVLYLICTPPFGIYVSWASCLELFIANTAGLLSGYFLYAGLQRRDSQIQFRAGWFLASVFSGVIRFSIR